jgi:hypothetical protein
MCCFSLVGMYGCPLMHAAADDIEPPAWLAGGSLTRTNHVRTQSEQSDILGIYYLHFCHPYYAAIL